MLSMSVAETMQWKIIKKRNKMFRVYDSVIDEEVGEFSNKNVAKLFARSCASDRAKEYLKDTNYKQEQFDNIVKLALPKFIIIDDDEKYIKNQNATSPQAMFGFETVEELGEALKSYPAKSRFVSIAGIVTTIRLMGAKPYLVASVLVEVIVGESMKKDMGSLFSYLEDNLSAEQLTKLSRELLMMTMAFDEDE